MEGEREEDTNVRVAVRIRPLSKKEIGNNEVPIIKTSSGNVVITNPASSAEEHSFAFDLIYDENSRQQSLMDDIGDPILDKAFAGYNGTIFAYGQTGSGKTWSMQGGDGDNEGIIPRMNKKLFEKIDQERSSRPHVHFLITVSYFEIYNEVIFDLLDPRSKQQTRQAAKGGLEIKEHPVLGVYVKGLQEIVVENPTKLQGIIEQGMSNRTVASTQMNADSSRSHSVFQVLVAQKDDIDETKNVFAKINLVDLAGSERVKSTGASGATLKEGANINKSLSALGNVINALVEQAKGKRGAFIPYRNSKLTRVLQESLGGNSITAMLAALSPAACNFDETLSTLKYANRAKAIKVNAVKNEESSQVSKLNDEIKMLREKLLQQPTSSSSNVDTSELEEKHRQQLRDLEQAMQSTWDEKARISEQHEKERKRLEMEQRKSQRELEATRERNWKMLEEKGDLDLSLLHVKETVRRFPKLSKSLDAWLASLKEIMSLEQKVGEQYTIVQVYKTSIDQDWNQFKSVSSKAMTVNYDKATLSIWRQKLDKLVVTRTEVKKWLVMQDSLNEAIAAFLDEVVAKQKEFASAIRNPKGAAGAAGAPGGGSGAGSGGAEAGAGAGAGAGAAVGAGAGASAAAQVEIQNTEAIRGMQLIKRQVTERKNRTASGIATARKGVITLVDIGGGLIRYLSGFVDALEASTADVQALPGNSARGNEELKGNLRGCIAAVMSTAQGQPAATAAAAVAVEAAPVEIKLPTDEYSIGCSSSSIQLLDGRSTSSSSRNPQGILPKGECCWVGAAQGGETGCYLEFTLQQPQVLAAIQVQGGAFVQQSTKAPATATAPTAPMAAGGAASNVAGVVLPCGIGLQQVAEEVEATSRALGDIIDWEKLIKKNPPEKFLKRPPVRFLFDLFKFIAESFPGCLPDSIEKADWDTVGGSKTSKLEFMEVMLSFVSKTLGLLEPATNSNSIITGQDAGRTNIFLQQLAISIFLFRENKPTAAAPATAAVAGAAAALESRDTVAGAPVESWPSTLSISVSVDGTSWEPAVSLGTGLMNSTSISKLKLPRIGPVKAVRISGTSNSAPAVALRIAVIVLRQQEEQAGSVAGAPDGSSGLSAVLDALDTLQRTAQTMLSVIDHMHSVDEKIKQRKQDEAKKQLEGLANEKLQLEKMRQQERAALTNEKQDLSDQLRAALSQLQETQNLLTKEQDVKGKIQEALEAAEAEKGDLQEKLQEKVDENAALQNDLLKMQAITQKDRLLMETLKAKLAEQERLNEGLTASVEEETAKKQALEAEREELLNQIIVLQEERDAARSSEESLFAQLSERTQDLERLQESYVDMTDRCNDQQDEIQEYRDQLEQYKDSLSTHFRVGPSHGSDHSSRAAATAKKRDQGQGQSAAPAGDPPDEDGGRTHSQRPPEVSRSVPTSPAAAVAQPKPVVAAPVTAKPVAAAPAPAAVPTAPREQVAVKKEQPQVESVKASVISPPVNDPTDGYNDEFEAYGSEDFEDEG